MSKRATTSGGPGTGSDVGTLWTMRRHDRTARCALISRRGRLEVQVLVDGDILLSQSCDRASEAFTLADGWKLRMADKGWRQVTPAPAAQPQGGPPPA